MLVGHSPVRLTLEAHLPPAVLLRGPVSVGKFTLAQHIAAHHGCAPVLAVETLNMEHAREVVEFTRTASPAGPKAVVACLDGASEGALNAILKVTEEPPGRLHFLLTASGPVLATVVSRCETHRVGLLSHADVYEVLTCAGMDPDSAMRCARLGDGTIAGSRAVVDREGARNLVVSVVKAVALGDRELFYSALKGWDDEAEAALTRFATEAMTGRWHLFNPSECYGLQHNPALVEQLIRSRTLLSARPRYAVRAAWDTLTSWRD